LEELQNGRYRLLRLIGQGAMGKVYLAEDTRIGRQVAIKVIQSEASLCPDDEATTDAVRLFQREAQIIARFNHPHILPLFDFDKASSDGSLPTYMVMPYCPDGSFADWLRRRRDQGEQSKDQKLLASQDVVQFVNQAADALQHAHEHSIIHCDVKPANFLLRISRDNPNCPDLLLADFGVARLGAMTTRSSQSIRGTPTYMAPEQWKGTPVPASDQYALAVMAYELLTGRAPFQGNATHMMYQHLTSEPPAPSMFNTHLSPTIDAVLLRALAKEPSARFPSVSDFARAFQAALLPEHAPSSYDTYVSPPTILPATSSQPPTSLYPTSRMPGAVSSSAKPVSTLRVDHQEKVYGTSSRGLSSGKVALLVGLAALVILLGVGSSLLLLNQNNADKTTASLHATATAHAQTANPYPPYGGTLVLSDPLRDNSRGYSWDVGNLSGQGICRFAGNTYHVVQNAIVLGGITTCNSQALPSQSNFAIQVQVTITSGDAGGIAFRAQDLDFYLFAIAPDGSYHFEVVQVNELQPPHTVSQGVDPAIHKGLNQPNLLAVVAVGNTIHLYVNKHEVDTVTDNTFQSGQIGLTAEESTNPTDVMFSNAMVWKL
jgi:eukaryotic-like serine/threonine-protein kinase